MMMASEMEMMWAAVRVPVTAVTLVPALVAGLVAVSLGLTMAVSSGAETDVMLAKASALQWASATEASLA